MESQHEKIYQWFDKWYPVDKTQDNLINCSFNVNFTTIVSDIFGIDDITFWSWIEDRFGEDGVFGITSGNSTHRQWYSTKRIPTHFKIHRPNNKPAIIEADGTIEYWVNGKEISQSRPTYIKQYN